MAHVLRAGATTKVTPAYLIIAGLHFENGLNKDYSPTERAAMFHDTAVRVYSVDES